MVAVHFMIYFGNAQATDTWLYFILNHVLGDWGAACFLMIMGIGQVLSGEKQADCDIRLSFKRAIVRGVFIFTVGLLMLALAWGPYEIWQWDILTLMGFATVLLFFCRFFPSWAILLIVAAIAACTPLLRSQLAIVPEWEKSFMQVPVISDYFPGFLFDPAEEMKVVWSAKNIALGFLFTGAFPVFPWVLFPLLGFVLGRRIVERKIQKDLPLLLPLGIVFILLGLGLGYAGSLRPGASIVSGYVVPLSFYPDSFPMVFFQFGASIAVLFTLYYLYDIRGTRRLKVGPFAAVFVNVGRSSLTFYSLHYMTIGWPLAVIYLFSGEYRICDLTGAWPAFGCALTSIVVLCLLLKLWDRRGGKYKLEWFLAALTQRLVRAH